MLCSSIRKQGEQEREFGGEREQLGGKVVKVLGLCWGGGGNRARLAARA